MLLNHNCKPTFVAPVLNLTTHSGTQPNLFTPVPALGFKLYNPGHKPTFVASGLTPTTTQWHSTQPIYTRGSIKASNPTHWRHQHSSPLQHSGTQPSPLNIGQTTVLGETITPIHGILVSDRVFKPY